MCMYIKLKLFLSLPKYTNTTISFFIISIKGCIHRYISTTYILSRHFSRLKLLLGELVDTYLIISVNTRGCKSYR